MIANKFELNGHSMAVSHGIRKRHAVYFGCTSSKCKSFTCYNLTEVRYALGYYLTHDCPKRSFDEYFSGG